MKIRINIILVLSIWFTQTVNSQITFPKFTNEKEIVAKLLETNWDKRDSTFKWMPNISESIQFKILMKDTLRTKIDTVFNYKDDYGDKKLILINTYKLNDVCHACQPVLGIIELTTNEAKDSLDVENVSKFVAHYGTWGEAPKKRSIFQLGESDYCIKIIDSSSGMGVKAESTFFIKDGKKIFSFISYLTNSGAVEFNYQKFKYSSTILFDKKNGTIKITKKGSEQNGSGKIVKVNSVTTYKYDGEFLDKISTVNIVPKKR